MPVEYLDPEIAGEGFHAEKHNPGAWMDAPDLDSEEWQPDIEPPHVNDYAALKKHKHYKQYFKPHVYRPFPAFMYHATLGEKIVKNRNEAVALGPEWSPTPIKVRIDMTGKSLPVKTETQKLAETVASALAAKTGGGDTASITATVAAVMAAVAAAGALPKTEASPEDEERQALFDLAKERDIKIDKRWSVEKIKATLGL